MGCLLSKPTGSKYLMQDDERVTGVRPSASNSPRSSRQSAPAKTSKANESSKASDSTAGQQTGQIKSFKPKLDPKDFRFKNLRGGVHVKAPGSINGQAFTIDDCKDCDLYVLDRCAQVTIDECTNCRIFIGPTTGSIFLRDSANVKCAFITRQLRLRNVTHTDISLLCRTQPIIEESHNIGLACYHMDYPALNGQLQGAKLDVLHNFWWHVYDFTPKPGNWKALASTGTSSLLGGLPEEVLTAAGITEVQANSPDQGSQVLSVGPPSEGESGSAAGYLCVLFPPDKEQAARQFLVQAQAKVGVSVLTTNQAAASGELLDAVKAQPDMPAAAHRALAASGPCVGVELQGSEPVLQQLEAAAQQLGGYSTHSTVVGGAFRHLGLQGM